MKRNKSRRRDMKWVKKQRDGLLRWQQQTGITLVEMRPTDRPDVWEYNAAPIHKIAREVMALAATGMSLQDAAKVVADRVKKEAALRRAQDASKGGAQ